MNFKQYYSSSTGNLYVLTLSSGKQIIIDPGVPFAKIQKALKFKFDNVICALCSHEHKDHSKAVPELLKAGVPVYASEETLDALGYADHRNANFIVPGFSLYFGDYSIAAFTVEHDSAHPVGFVVREDKEVSKYHIKHDYFLFACDSSVIKTFFRHGFKIIALECSYDKDILEKNVEEGKVNESLAKRLLDSHMEVNTLLRYLRTCNLIHCKELHLLHCSALNLDIKKIQKKIKEDFFLAVVTRYGKDE